jgi:hypothetical protein
MNAKAIETRYQIKVKPCSVLIRKLEGRVKKFESKYEVPTEKMLTEVRAGRMPQSKDVDQWMQSHFVLGTLRNAKTTKRSGQARLEHSGKLPVHLRTMRSKSPLYRFNKKSA